jgi:hypothetical protein
MLTIASWTAPVFSSADNSSIDVTATLSDGSVHPYTARAADPVSAALFASIVEAGGVAAYVAPTLSLSQQAKAAIQAGVTVTSTATPPLNGTYACDPATQANLSSMYNLIQRAGGAAFPAGLTALPWADAGGAIHTFTAVSDFLNFETAIGDYVLKLQLIIATNSGTLPSPAITIP